MKKNIVTIAIGIVLLILITAAVIVISSQDKTGPVITFDIPIGQQITYTSGQDKQILIQYAKATDRKDGDVSDSIIIEDIYLASELTTARVIYVARDKNNNITKASQVVKYIASQEEIDNQNKISEAENESTKGALANATVATTTKAQETTSVASAKPVLTLSQSEVTITQGSYFDVVKYVKEITDDKDNKEALFKRIIVGGTYNKNSQPGDYTVSIYCTDTEGNESNSEKIVLHVQAATPDPEPADPTPDPEPADPTPDPAPADPTPDPAPADPTPDPAPAEPTPDPAPADPTPDPEPADPTPDSTPIE